MSFYNIIEKYRDFNFEEYFDKVTKEDVLRSISGNNLNESDLLNILSPRAEECLEEMAQKARDNSLKYFGRTVLLYTPMYISNYCINKCVYCGYNVENEICRKKLTIEEVKREGMAISKEGFKHLLILTGESEYHSPISYLEESVKVLKEYFPSIGIEVYPMSEEGYKQIVDAGVDGLTIYQETYDEEIYDRIHLSGPKKNYRNRLDAPERGAKAGMRNIGIGALLGLNDFRKDAFFTAMHGRYLLKKYPHLEIAYATPRIRPCSGGLEDVKEVTDRNLVQALLSYRLFHPQGGINLSTREDKVMRSNLIELGITKISAGVKIAVGARTAQNKGDTQFDINDESSTEEVKKMIIEKGYQPIFKDWERF